MPKLGLAESFDRDHGIGEHRAVDLVSDFWRYAEERRLSFDVDMLRKLRCQTDRDTC